MEKYRNEYGKTAVLVSPGYGAGWSTWGDDQSFLAMDKTLVEMKLSGASSEEVEKHLNDIGVSQYVGGWMDIKIEWLDEGTAFAIEEYDGSESLRLIQDLMLVA